MTHDLDAQVRDAMRRGADDAPTVVDLDGVLARSRTITRHRRVQAAVGTVAAGALLVGAAVGIGAVVDHRSQPGPLDRSPTATVPQPGAVPLHGVRCVVGVATHRVAHDVVEVVGHRTPPVMSESVRWERSVASAREAWARTWDVLTPRIWAICASDWSS